MAIAKLTTEQLDTMSYTDIAEYVLEQKGKKMKIADLFTEVIKLRGDDPKAIFESKIGDFFGLVSSDNRFVMLDKGLFDLSKKHKNSINMNLDDEEDEEEIVLDDEENEEEDEDVINYDEAIDVDDDTEEDDFKDLVIIDSDDESGMDL
jgi:DNA-directed RNA polymerase delta subunit